ncbi:MAG: hypothetical protein P8X81_07010 [Woeseiaceae bacterium]|jgi:hypothetical protein
MNRLNPFSIRLRGKRVPQWRDALKALAMPARRVHYYRNLHRNLFYDAVCDLDCGGRK